MSGNELATILILISALLHATLNVLFKASENRIIAWAIIGMVGFVVSIPFATQLPLPTPEQWRWLAMAIVAHTSYQLLLLSAYKYGELNFTYPVARGMGPMLVALFAGLYLGEVLGAFKITGILMISLGAAGAGLAQVGRLKLDAHKVHAVAFTLLTGVSIAAYTSIDAVGVRMTAEAGTFIVWLFIGQAFPIVSIALWRMRGKFLASVRQNGAKGLIMAAAALTSYSLALYAFRVGSLAETAALRETSILFATAFSVFLLKEKPGKLALLSIGVIAAGAILLKV